MDDKNLWTLISSPTFIYFELVHCNEIVGPLVQCGKIFPIIINVSGNDAPCTLLSIHDPFAALEFNWSAIQEVEISLLFNVQRLHSEQTLKVDSRDLQEHTSVDASVKNFACSAVKGVTSKQEEDSRLSSLAQCTMQYLY